MTETKRFQLDLTETEHTEMERLMGQAGIKTKREFVSNALTLFRWAAREVSAGSVIAAIPKSGTPIKQLEMPALSGFVTLASFFPPGPPTREEILAAASRGGRLASEVLADLLAPLEGPRDGTSPSGADGR